jgi:hypothetical protein
MPESPAGVEVDAGLDAAVGDEGILVELDEPRGEDWPPDRPAGRAKGLLAAGGRVAQLAHYALRAEGLGPRHVIGPAPCGQPAPVVAETVSRTLTARWPRARYLAGNESRPQAVMATMPGPIGDAIRRRVFHQPARHSAAFVRTIRETTGVGNTHREVAVIASSKITTAAKQAPSGGPLHTRPTAPPGRPLALRRASAPKQPRCSLEAGAEARS